MKRIVLATFFGLCAGVLCATGGIAAGIFKLTALNLLWVFLNRGLMGFTIGISGLRLHWAWNGILLGMAVGSVFSLNLLMQVGFTPLPFINFFVNGLFGFLIELFTTKVCKAPALVPPVTRPSMRVAMM